jgi:rhomboid protease GluP
MTTRTFGRRGAGLAMQRPMLRPTAAAAPVAAAAQAAALARESAPPAHEGAIPEKSLIADIPYLTAGLIVLLMVIFGLEKHWAFDIGKDGSLSVQSLIAFGAVSRDLVIGSGEWWRIALAPLLHASAWHLAGNCFALFFVGLRLEPMVGRGWFALIFMISALGGVAGSLYGNPPDMPSVGASGAITGLIGALFVVSFHHRADPIEQRMMRRTALSFGIPALLPLVVATAGNVDYFAHAGGGLAGAAFGLALCAIWSADGARPELGRLAAAAALLGLAVSAACAGIASTRYKAYAADAAQFIPSAEIPATLKAGAKRSAELVARYPKDPRAHLIRGFAMIEAHRLSEAESELRAAMALAPAGGLSLLPTATFTDCPQLDLICVPGGAGVVDVMGDRETIDFVRKQAAGARYVTSVCTGAFVLGAAGLLRGRRATTHWGYTELLPLVGATYEKARIVTDGNVITAAGVASGIDLALHIAAEIAGEDTAHAIQLAIEYDPAPRFASGHPDKAPAAITALVGPRYERAREAYRAVLQR